MATTAIRPSRPYLEVDGKQMPCMGIPSKYDEQVKNEYRDFYLSGAEFPGNLSPLALFDDFLLIQNQEILLAISRRCQELECEMDIDWDAKNGMFIWRGLRDKRKQLEYFREFVTCDDGKPGYRTASDVDIAEQRRRESQKRRDEKAEAARAKQAKLSDQPPTHEEGRCVYFAEAVGLNRVKIGCANDPSGRLLQLMTGCPVQLRLACFIPGGEQLESELHVRFASARIHREWFHLSDEIKAFIQEQGGSV